jgi:hypothetical protein
LETILRNLYFASLAVLLLVVLIAALLRYYVRSRRSSEMSWEDLLHRLAWIDRDAIATIALDAVSEEGDSRPHCDCCALDTGVIWNLLGGLEGLEVIERNCQVLVELATYLQRWYPEAVVVAEQLRLNAREIEWHVSRMKGAAQTGNLEASFAPYAQRAVVIYYMMTRHLLTVYGQANFPRIAELQQAI